MLIVFHLSDIKQKRQYEQRSKSRFGRFDNIIIIIILFTTIDNIIYMPIVRIAMYSGRTQREKDRVAEAITEDVSKILNVEKKR